MRTSLCPFAHTFVHLHVFFLFLLLFSLSMTSFNNKFMELLQIKKNGFSVFLFVGHFFRIYLFLHVCPFFSPPPFFCFILMCFWTFFFFVLVLECFSFVAPFLCICFFEDSVRFDHRFPPLCFSFYIPSFFFHKNMSFFNCFRSYCLFFFEKKPVFLVYLSFKVVTVPLCFLFLFVFLFSKKLAK